MLSPSDIERLSKELPDYAPLPRFGAALPFYECVVDLRLLAKQQLSAIEQIVLRCVGSRIDTPEEIGVVLGIDFDLLKDALYNLQSADLIDPIPLPEIGTSTFALSERGSTALVEQCYFEPETVRFRLLFDALTGEMQPANRLRFVNAIDADNAGLRVLPSRCQTPTIGDLHLPDLERVVRETRQHEPSRVPEGRLYDVLEIVNVYRVFLPCDVVAFDAPDHSHVAFRVLDRGTRMRQHEITLQGMFPRYPEILPLERGGPTLEPAVAIQPWLTRADENKTKLEGLSEAVAAIQSDIEQSEAAAAVSGPEDALSTRQQLVALRAHLEQVQAELGTAAQQLRSVRRIDVQEHRKLLLDGLRQARRRVIIISPWIQPVAVTFDLLKEIRGALKRGVHVVIGWGFPEELTGIKLEKTKATLRKLTALSEEQPKGKLDVVEHGNTHEKVLIVDKKFMVITSFNWLSFRGEAQLGWRDEAGVYLELPEMIEDSAKVYLERLSLEWQELSEETLGGPKRKTPKTVSDAQLARLQGMGIRVRAPKRSDPGTS